MKPKLSTPAVHVHPRLLNVFWVTLSSATAVLASIAKPSRCCRQPHVKFGDPVLQRVDGNNNQHTAGVGAAEEHVNECDHLQCLAETHAVSQDTAKTTACPTALQGLHNVVIQEPNTTDLPTDNDQRYLLAHFLLQEVDQMWTIQPKKVVLSPSLQCQ